MCLGAALMGEEHFATSRINSCIFAKWSDPCFFKISPWLQVIFRVSFSINMMRKRCWDEADFERQLESLKEPTRKVGDILPNEIQHRRVWHWALGKRYLCWFFVGRLMEVAFFDFWKCGVELVFRSGYRRRDSKKKERSWLGTRERLIWIPRGSLKILEGVNCTHFFLKGIIISHYKDPY